MNFKAVLLSLALTALLAQPMIAVAPESADPLKDRMIEVTAFFSTTPPGDESLFSPSFLKYVSLSQVANLSRNLYDQYGPILSTKQIEHPSSERGTFLLTFQRGYEARLELTLDAEPPHRIAGLWIGTPTPVADDLQALMPELQKLPGKVSFTAARLEDKAVHPLAELNSDLPLAVGSGFKLFVLGALLEEIAAGKRRWTDTLTLKSDLKSLPSGILQDWPDNSPLTLHSLASLMISMSDNTATDHLLMNLGRERIENMQMPMGMSHPDLNRPFLTTREMFLLKGGGWKETVPAYSAKQAADRRSYLKNVVARLPWHEAGKALQQTPVAIDKVEWFASSRDMVQTMNWLRLHSTSLETMPARKILAINPGVSFDSSQWSYVGYKGGSEPGVLSMTFLLQSKQGTWYAMSACWSDTQAEVDTNRMIALMKKAGSLLAKSKI